MALTLASPLPYAIAQTTGAQPMSSSREPQSLTFDALGQSVAYLKEGSGPALVIVHGLGGHKEDFKAVIQILSSHYTVYAFDMLGFGASSRTAPSVGPGAQADVIQALLEHEHLRKASVMGNSAGAWAAATFAAKYPGSINKLILSDAAGLKATLSGPPPVNFAPDTVADMQKLLQTVIASDFAHSTEFAAQALAQFKASGEAASLGKLFGDFSKPDNKDKVLDDVLPDVKAPTLVVWGAQDALFPPALADVVVGGVKGSHKELIPNSSHFPQIDNPKGLSAAVAKFLG
jgi:pimeloyl-ACP methyl ester carboxylesterase